MDNLLANLPDELSDEWFETLVETGAVRIERIVSRGHASPAVGWYDQDRAEWVLLVRGAARLAFDDGREVELGPGDWLEIPAHRKHRVAWTDPDTETVWLAVHYG
jgi:cupin 2 domain-containing protein